MVNGELDQRIRFNFKIYFSIYHLLFTIYH